MLDNSRTNPFHVLLRIPVPWVFVLGYLSSVALEYVVPTRPVMDGLPAIGIVGAGVFLLGAALAGWGWLTFFRARTTTVPGKASLGIVPAGLGCQKILRLVRLLGRGSFGGK
jgi:hypothetical protein